MAKRLSLKQWENIFRNLEDSGEEVEIVWLDTIPIENAEWVLCCEEELFEDGFETEELAQKRLDFLEGECLY